MLIEQGTQPPAAFVVVWPGQLFGETSIERVGLGRSEQVVQVKTDRPRRRPRTVGIVHLSLRSVNST
jgi:hypothetical protein